MLRQLERLTRPLPAAGPRAVALAVYADENDVSLAAADLGFEGVACVDDAARGVVLFCDLWLRTRSARCRERALGLLDVVLYMEDGDGRFANFVRDWRGTRNVEGPTSHPGGAFWQARALHAVAKAAVVLEEERARASAARALRHVPHDAAADVRAIHALAAIELGRADLLERWCDEIAACRDGDLLLDHPGQLAPHLWGHLQEGVLAEGGALLRRRDLVDLARRSADVVFVPVVASAFDLPTVQPYGVACAVYAMDRLAAATGEDRYDALAHDARAWFDGRNPPREPTYDRSLGRVADGIDDRVVNRHSGAEANITAAQALLDDVAARLVRDGDAWSSWGLSSRSLDVSSASATTRR